MSFRNYGRDHHRQWLKRDSPPSLFLRPPALARGPTPKRIGSCHSPDIRRGFRRKSSPLRWRSCGSLFLHCNIAAAGGQANQPVRCSDRRNCGVARSDACNTQRAGFPGHRNSDRQSVELSGLIRSICRQLKLIAKTSAVPALASATIVHAAWQASDR